MRVLYVIDGLGTGGAERSLAEMLPRLAGAGVDATIACFHRRKEGVEQSVLDGGADVRFLAGLGPVGRARRVRGLIGAERPDLVHTTLLESSLAGRLGAMGSGVPVLTSLVNTSYAPERLADPNIKRSSLTALKVVDGWTARHLTAHFHAITQAVKDAAVRDLNLPGDRLTVIYRGRDEGRLGRASPERRQRVRAGLGVGADAEVVLSVGRQEHQKGHRHLLAAVADLLHSHPKLVVLVAGRRGHATPDVEAAVTALDAGDRVRLLGHRDDIPDLLAAADVFAMPSIYEGLGGSVIEAMALGLPIVASDLPALREVLEPDGNALLVPSGAPAPLAQALAGLLSDPARAAAFGRRSRELFEAHFTLERSTTSLLELYDRLVPGRRPGPGSPL
jgi:glycosyltransferase involved in cell wall biosynthesis